jgi:general secretion pathway protein L
MQYISINIGTYSIKFLNFTLDKKKVVFKACKEVVMDSDEFNVMESDVVTDLQFNIIADYLKEIETDYRLILNTPSELITERILNLPVKNKKKAQLMIPFQLEEDIPFSLSDVHMASSMQIHKESTRALVNMVKEENFQAFFEKMQQYAVSPRLLTSEVSVLENFIRHTNEILPTAFCVLDLGHTTSKAYFFLNRELKAIHTSYTAGHAISEAICDAYSINSEEAAIYKHQNCFFLTQDQYAKVNEAQQIFGNLMDKTFEPLMHEIRRWHVGFKVQNGIAINNIYLIGGTSNIKNINYYMTEQLGISVSTFQAYSETNSEAIDSNEKQQRKFAYAALMAQAYVFKSEIINFLTGRFSFQGKMDLPLQSFSFIATRLAIVALILFTSALTERFFINRDLLEANNKIKTLVKNPMLAISPKDQRTLTKSAAPLVQKIKKDIHSIDQTVKTLQSSVQVNALKSLQKLALFTSDLDIEIIQFQSTHDGDFTIVLKANEPAVITNLDETLKSSDIANLFTEKNLAKRTLTITGSQE